MISRIALGILSATLAFAAVSPLHATPTASAAAPAASVTYHIERHNQQVVVENADGKALTTFSAATPTQSLLVWSAAGPAADTSAQRPLTLTLKDQKGRRLRSTPILVMCPQTISMNYHSITGGTVLAISTTPLNPPDPNYWPSSGLIFTSGTNGYRLGFVFGSKRFKYVYEAHDFAILDHDGETLLQGIANSPESSMEISSPAEYGQHLNQNGTGTLQLNGTSIAIDKVTKEGKVYQSVPWRGHTLVVAEPCSWSITIDGKLTVSAPSTAKTTANK